MKRNLMTLAAVLCCAMTTVFTACTDDDNSVKQPETNPDDQTAYIEKMVPVNRDGNNSGTVAIRFYEDMPSVPYISVADFQGIVVPGTTVSVTKTGTGTYELKNAGGTLTVSTVAETCAFDDFLGFTNQMGLVQAGMENGYYDGLPYVRFNHQTLSGGSPAVTFDYSTYGINLRADDSAVYFPFATLADLYADLYGHNTACNGEKVVYDSKDDNGDDGIGGLDSDFKMENLMKNKERKADMVAYNYAELCFTIDHFYGMPTGSDFEKSILTDRPSSSCCCQPTPTTMPTVCVCSMPTSTTEVTQQYGILSPARHSLRNIPRSTAIMMKESRWTDIGKACS